MKIWEPKPGTLWATKGLLQDCFIFTFSPDHYNLIMDISRDYNITVKVIMKVIFLTGRCTGLGELQAGPICAALGRGCLQFPGESGRPFVCRRTAGC
jgi:hypothetical protein